MDKKTASPVASLKGKSSGFKGFKKGFLLRANVIEIMIEVDTGRAHHESVCPLSSEDCTHCSYGCTKSDLPLNGFNVNEVVHEGTFSEEFLLNQVEDDEELMKVCLGCGQAIEV